MNAVQCNITMPVYNRPEMTLKNILNLRGKTRTSIPYVLTVVDNGSEPELRRRLLDLHREGIIHNLFLLPRNMGISCACNVGWQAVDAPFYLKFDNDMHIRAPDWLDRLFRLYARVEPRANLGPSFSLERVRQRPRLRCEDGELGVCGTNLCGQCILVPRAVSDILGYWSEDYGLYGAEDGDYGLRMQCAGFPQYYYYAAQLMEHQGKDPKDYDPRFLDKGLEHCRLFVEEDGTVGLFRLNSYLYKICARSWRPPLRCRVLDVTAGHEVILGENPEYATVAQALHISQELVQRRYARYGEAGIAEDAFVWKIKRIWEDCGQGCEAILKGAGA
ncbi:glycosyltransferase [Desulfovibrio legallii]|uniref:Glycosyltransferase, GT2 family n=1 Tax=Desulfovibrio legallii TaxID=571438 RepID=A0A1G7LWU2_9BACT|nr:glycosyltransferase [Desulfovibrio legallii]SDF53975.1 Glycosyltransferase, GT2 family [Desulfovibrio legallii]